jgi:hypothetical protein
MEIGLLRFAQAGGTREGYGLWAAQRSLTLPARVPR